VGAGMKGSISRAPSYAHPLPTRTRLSQLFLPQMSQTADKITI